jgi:hypothetical protein
MWKSIVNKVILIKCYRNKVYLEGIVLWIGIFLMLIRARNFMLMPIQIRIRIRIGIKMMQIHIPHMRILPQVSTSDFFFTFNHSFASLQSFIFLISVKYVIIRSILDRILKFCGASICTLSSFSYAWHWYRSGSACRRIRILIRQNDAYLDPQHYWEQR